MIPALQGSIPRIHFKLVTIALTLLPIVLGGWYLYVALTSYAPLFSRPVALPEPGQRELLLDDFVVFYTAGKHISSISGAVYDPVFISNLQADETGQQPGTVAILPFFNPPSALLPLSLFGLLPIGLAAATWLLGGIGLAITSLRTLLSPLSRSSEMYGLLGLGLVSSLPLYQAVVHGQMTFVLLAGFCLYGAGILRPQGDKYAVLGLLLLALKPVFLPLPLLYLVLRRRRRPIMMFSIVELGLVLLAAMLFGPTLPIDYLTMSMDALSWDEVNGISTYGMFGWTGFWRGIVGPDAHTVQLILTATSSLTTVVAFALVFRRGDQPGLALSAIVVLSILVSPHSYAQDLLLLTVPILLLMKERPHSRVSYALAAIAWFAAFVHFDTLHLTGIGAANIGLVLVGVAVIARGATLRSPIPASVPFAFRRASPMDIVFTSADAAGS